VQHNCATPLTHGLCVNTRVVKHGRQLSKQRHVACVLTHVVKHGRQPQGQACRVCADTWAAAWEAAVFGVVCGCGRVFAGLLVTQ
jgi:hypothetical protein